MSPITKSNTCNYSRPALQSKGLLAAFVPQACSGSDNLTCLIFRTWFDSLNSRTKILNRYAHPLCRQRVWPGHPICHPACLHHDRKHAPVCPTWLHCVQQALYFLVCHLDFCTFKAQLQLELVTLGNTCHLSCLQLQALFKSM